jgi:hypothetical protein
VLSLYDLRFLTAVVMKSTIFWDTTLCSPLKVSRRFGGSYHLHFLGRRISRARNQGLCLPPAFTLVSCAAYSSTQKMEAICSPNRRLTFNGLHGAISKKIVLFNIKLSSKIRLIESSPLGSHVTGCEFWVFFLLYIVLHLSDLPVPNRSRGNFKRKKSYCFMSLSVLLECDAI